MNDNRAHDEMKERQKRESVELCGKNRGPHSYIPIAWMDKTVAEGSLRVVTRFMCTTCFKHVSVANLLENAIEVSY